MRNLIFLGKKRRFYYKLVYLDRRSGELLFGYKMPHYTKRGDNYELVGNASEHIYIKDEGSDWGVYRLYYNKEKFLRKVPKKNTV